MILSSIFGALVVGLSIALVGQVSFVAVFTMLCDNICSLSVVIINQNLLSYSHCSIAYIL